jgi:N-methylhydantoinase A
VQTWRCLIEQLETSTLENRIENLIEQARTELAAEGITDIHSVTSLDLRYLGQSHTLNIEYSTIEGAIERFHQEHEKQYGHRIEVDIELLNIRLSAVGLQETRQLPSISKADGPGTRYRDETEGDARVSKKIGLMEIHRRQLKVSDELVGPLLVLEDHATTFIKAGWQGAVDFQGNIRLSRIMGTP